MQIFFFNISLLTAHNSPMKSAPRFDPHSQRPALTRRSFGFREWRASATRWSLATVATTAARGIGACGLLPNCLEAKDNGAESGQGAAGSKSNWKVKHDGLTVPKPQVRLRIRLRAFIPAGKRKICCSTCTEPQRIF